MGPEIALAASARPWPDRLHRFLLDHGGGRVRCRVMSPDQATGDRYEVLFIDDVCSFLTPRLVRGIRELGREIVGVYDPADAPDAKRHLLECGITDMIEAQAGPDEFLTLASTLVRHRSETSSSVSVKPRSFRVGVLGPIGGVGATEIALGVASSLSTRRSTILIDLDQLTPSLAQRLDLPLHPNLLTALDAAHHSSDGMMEAILTDYSVDVIGGLVNPVSGTGRDLAAVEIEGLLDELGASGYEVVVADLGSPTLDGFDILRFHLLIVVGMANPVGISRLVRVVQGLTAKSDAPDCLAVVNRVGPVRGRRHEIKGELARLLPKTPLVLIPEDRRLERASWDGNRPSGGSFAKSVVSIASLIDGAIR